MSHRKDVKEVVEQYVSRQGPAWPEPRKQEEGRGGSAGVVLSRDMALWAERWEDVQQEA